MSKLEQLKDMVAKQFANADSKESIEALANINKSIDETIEEIQKQQLEDSKKYDELLQLYKNSVYHNSVGNQPVKDASEPASLESIINSVLNGK